MATPQPSLTSKSWIPTPSDAKREARVLGAGSAPLNVVIFPSGGTSPVPTTRVDKETEQRFRQLADQWLSETVMLSDPVRIFLHHAHFKIVGMGEKVLPLILKELESERGQWFVALDAISPINPVTPDEMKSFEQTKAAWLRWGRAEGLI